VAHFWNTFILFRRRRNVRSWASRWSIWSHG